MATRKRASGRDDDACTVAVPLSGVRLAVPESSSPECSFVGTSSALRELVRGIDVVARTDATVLLVGETGTGKSFVARAIRERSPRVLEPFVRFDCRTTPHIVESELFGHEGAFVAGAFRGHAGRFESARNGTLLLDEVGELPLEAQAKLLRVIQHGTFERLGGSETLRANARIIAATHHDLAASVAHGRFRADLHWRLNVFTIRIPTLRERRADIPKLALHFASECAKRLGKDLRGIRNSSIRTLVEYDWPGNARELKNVVERAVILSNAPLLRVDLGIHRLR